MNNESSDLLKETMTKRFFAPIWKCDEIESRLEQLEREGWRLERISGFRKFQFVKVSPKTATYFFTCSLTKEQGMIQTEQVLKRQYKAAPISGSFIEGLKTTTVYRIHGEADLRQRKFYRNRYLSGVVFRYILLGLFLQSYPLRALWCPVFRTEDRCSIPIIFFLPFQVLVAQ